MCVPKEPRFFTFAETELPNNVWEKDSQNNFEEYKHLFKDANESRRTGEASVHYLFQYEKTINNIKKYVPHWESLKIIIILRNPVDRAFSNYSMLRLKNFDPLDFRDSLKVCEDRRKNGEGMFLDYIGPGMYYKQVKAYLDNFSHVKIYLFDDLLKNSIELMRDLYTFIGVENAFLPKNLRKKYNPSGIPRSKRIQKLLENIKIFLINYNWQRIVKPIVLLFVTDESKRERMFNKTIKLIDNAKEKNLKKAVMDEDTKILLKNLYKKDILKLQNMIKRDLTNWLS